MSESKPASSTREYFIMTTSFAAPFVSDTDSVFVAALSPEAALTKAAREYKHPCGLYAAVCYENAEAYHRGLPPLAKWLCNHEQAKRKATAGLVSYGYLGDGPGHFKVNDEWITVKNPKAGSVVVLSE